MAPSLCFASRHTASLSFASLFVPCLSFFFSLSFLAVFFLLSLFLLPCGRLKLQAVCVCVFAPDSLHHAFIPLLFPFGCLSVLFSLSLTPPPCSPSLFSSPRLFVTLPPPSHTPPPQSPSPPHPTTPRTPHTHGLSILNRSSLITFLPEKRWIRFWGSSPLPSFRCHGYSLGV